MNTTRLVVKPRTKLFIQGTEKVDILEMEGFNLMVLTSLGSGALTKKTRRSCCRTGRVSSGQDTEQRQIFVYHLKMFE